MKVHIDSRDRQFLGRLHRIGGGTIPEICDDHGVTATAVRQRLTRLQGQGMVSREMVRAGRGRPHYIYRPTDAGLRELGENYSDLAIILWQAIKGIDDPSVRAVVLEKVQDEMVRRYGRAVRADTPEKRFEELTNELSNQGFDVEVDTSGPLPILRENSCPYLDLAVADPEICKLEQAVFERILGAPIRLSQCSLDGSNCCEFHLDREAS